VLAVPARLFDIFDDLPVALILIIAAVAIVVLMALFDRVSDWIKGPDDK